MEETFNLHTLEDRVNSDEEGFLEAEQEFGGKWQIPLFAWQSRC